MQAGTLTKKLLKNERAGEGRRPARASPATPGSSTEPHLHIHAIKGTEAEAGPLRPLLFHDVFAIDPADLSPPSPCRAVGAPVGRGPAGAGVGRLHLAARPASAVEGLAGPRRPDHVGAGGQRPGPRTGSTSSRRGSDRQLSHKWWDGSTWHNWQKLGGTFKGGPAAVSWGPNRIDVFVRGTDDHLGHLWWDGTAWQGWQDLGGPIKSAPAVASWAANRLDVFAAGADGELAHKWWDGSTWHGWQNLGGTFKGAPAAVSWGPNRIDVFVRGMDDHLGHLWWNGSAWNGWQDLGGPLTSAPAVASWAANRLDVFAAGTDGQLTHKRWNGSTWGGWDWIGGAFHDNPAAVSWGPNRIDVFVRRAWTTTSGTSGGHRGRLHPQVGRAVHVEHGAARELGLRARRGRAPPRRPPPASRRGRTGSRRGGRLRAGRTAPRPPCRSR